MSTEFGTGARVLIAGVTAAFRKLCSRFGNVHARKDGSAGVEVGRSPRGSEWQAECTCQQARVESICQTSWQLNPEPLCQRGARRRQHRCILHSLACCWRMESIIVWFSEQGSLGGLSTSFRVSATAHERSHCLSLMRGIRTPSCLLTVHTGRSPIAATAKSADPSPTKYNPAWAASSVQMTPLATLHATCSLRFPLIFIAIQSPICFLIHSSKRKEPWADRSRVTERSRRSA